MAFYYAYPGNKRLECKYITDLQIPWKNFTTIVEPFAGSAAVSRYIFKEYPLEDRHFVINDLDPFLMSIYTHVKETKTSEDLFKYCRDHSNTKDYLEIKDSYDSDIFRDFYRKKIKYDRYDKGHGKRGKAPTAFPKCEYTTAYTKIDKFISQNNTHLTREDWLECVIKYKDDPKCFIFLDPPYFGSYNGEYYGFESRLDENFKERDTTQMFIDMVELFKTAKATVLCITNGNPMLRYIYKDFILKDYSKTYSKGITIKGITKRVETTHIIVSNIQGLGPKRTHE